MRIRNIKDAPLKLEASKYYITDPEEYKGKWQKLFNNDNPITIEIGMGKGDFIVGMAKLHPELNFIGIEKYQSILVRASRKLELEELDNVKIISVDAIDLANYFDKEIYKIYLNFSDPWPKTRHHKRRLTYKTFLEVYDKIFKDESNIEFKTDNDSLFESSLVYLNNYGYTFDEVLLNLWDSDKENVKTEYEMKFTGKGFKIKYLRAHKNIVGKNE